MIPESTTEFWVIHLTSDATRAYRNQILTPAGVTFRGCSAFSNSVFLLSLSSSFNQYFLKVSVDTGGGVSLDAI